MWCVADVSRLPVANFVQPPLWFVIAMFAAAAALAVVLAYFGHRPKAPNVYKCQHCHQQFRSPSHKQYPQKCPNCQRTDWHQR